MRKVALISVYDKQGIETFAKELVELGWEIYGSGGTVKHLAKNGVAAKDTEELIGGGAILGHRVVTLSREIYAGLLATDMQSDKDELKQLGIPRIDLVCVDMYPLREEVAKKNSTELSVIEKTDIGGPTMLRAAAKGRRIVLSRPQQRQEVIEWLKAGKPGESYFLRRLAADAEEAVAAYSLDSARYSSQGRHDGNIGTRHAGADYGENPWQKQAWLYSNESVDRLGIPQFKQIQGRPLSYNNYADIDRLLQTMTHIAAGFDVNTKDVPLIALGAKHGNVCGAAIGTSSLTVIQNMLNGDLRAIFGGVIMLNFAIDEPEAEVLLTYKVDSGRRLIDGIIAPSISKKAVSLLERKGNKCRLVVNPALKKLDKNSLDTAQRTRYVRGGWLQQDNYTHILPGQTDEDVILAWAIGATSNSNTITLVKDGMLIGNGVGQQDRVSAAELAIKRATDAEHNIRGATAYSDSFFPFPDGPITLADAGVTTIFASSGSVGDEKVQTACQKRGVKLITKPDKEVRGFYAH